MMQITHKLIKNKGFSIIEMLIAVAIFATLAIVATQSLATSLKNSKKSESLSKARENSDYAVSTMERLLRNAQQITACTASSVTYEDEYGNSTGFTCSGGYIASGSARLTSTSVVIDCTAVFNCPAQAPGVPQTIEITVKATDAQAGSGVEGAEVTSKTKLLLRNYTAF